MINANATKLDRWRDAVGWAAKLKYPGWRLLGQPLLVDLFFTMLTTKPDRMGLPHAQKPDGDKLLRAVLDSLTGIVWKDDCLASKSVVEKRWGSEPGVLVKIYDWSGP